MPVPVPGPVPLPKLKSVPVPTPVPTLPGCRHNPAMRRPALAFLSLLLATATHAQLKPGEDALPAAVLAALQRTELPADALAAVALPLPGATGAFWQRPWGHQPQRSMQPGSAMKLVTSIVALDLLGPNLRGSTELRSAAPLLPNGTLQGDLVLKGGADPELGVPQFWALLQELRAAGVRTITGNLIVDRTLWRPARMDLGLPPFDTAPDFPYNVIPDALQLAGALLPLRLSSNADTLQADTVPPLAGLSISSRMTLTDGRCAAWDEGWQSATVKAATVKPAAVEPAAVEPAGAAASDGAAATPASPASPLVIELQGRFPRHCTQRAELQLIDRQQLTERLFATLWQQLGGQWLGHAVEAAAPADTRVLARRLSRPWGEVLRTLNKTSDNALTRMLFLNLGVAGMADQPQASTAELARRVVLRWLAEHRIDSTGVVMDNGSGLSRSERISPWQLAQMLKVAHSARYASELVMSLPVAGVDGTMRNRLKDSPAAGWARLKTGTLRNVVALAGYVSDARGQVWAVAMMINHEQASRGRPVLDALVDHIARHGPHALQPTTVGPQGDGP